MTNITNEVSTDLKLAFQLIQHIRDVDEQLNEGMINDSEARDLLHAIVRDYEKRFEKLVRENE